MPSPLPPSTRLVQLHRHLFRYDLDTPPGRRVLVWLHAVSASLDQTWIALHTGAFFKRLRDTPPALDPDVLVAEVVALTALALEVNPTGPWATSLRALGEVALDSLKNLPPRQPYDLRAAAPRTRSSPR